MQGPVKERWQILCEQAANEQDPQKLMDLVREINRPLEEKQKRLTAKRNVAD
jgi:hypothetical protein